MFGGEDGCGHDKEEEEPSDALPAPPPAPPQEPGQQLVAKPLPPDHPFFGKNL